MELENERPERIWVHPNHKRVLQQIYEIINKESIKITGYPIPKGMPLTSEIVSKILEKLIIHNPKFIKIEKIQDQFIFNAKISLELKNPIIIFVSENKKELTKKEKEYIKIQLRKIRGLKKNDISI